jgi:hypothetical protein
MRLMISRATAWCEVGIFVFVEKQDGSINGSVGLRIG